MANLKIDISLGEAVDRLTILRIKMSKITNEEKLRNVSHEHDLLLESVENYCSKNSVSVPEALSKDLQQVNRALWEVEDKLRDFERASSFGDDFIQKAREVYFLNDKRANIKKQINLNAPILTQCVKIYHVTQKKFQNISANFYQHLYIMMIKKEQLNGRQQPFHMQKNKF